MVGDVDALQSLYLRGLAPPLVAVAAGTVAVGLAVAILPVAAAILLLGLVVSGVAVPAIAGRLARMSGTRRAGAEGHLSSEIVELLRGAPELVVFGRDEKALGRVRAADRVLVRIARRDALAAGVADWLGIVVTGATVVAVLVVAVSAHASGDLDRVFVAVLALLAFASFEAVAPLSQAARELSTTLASGRRVLELTDRVPSVHDPAEPALDWPARPPAIVLERVRARYAPDELPALDDVSFTLEPGRRVALVGPSGSGKTTVVNLLLRFLDPEYGRVTLAGRDLREYRQEDVRRTIAVAGQDAYLFSTTIRENVRLGRPEASDAEIEDVLRRVRVWEWIASLPQGIDTLVGEEGTQLSGGQRQRVALARALLADTPVLVLDEPTAHLDPDTAERVVGDMLAAANNRTVLLITHRPEGLDLVDEVVVLAEGRIALAH
jgi:thiol reductant ABC exporter CydC subunit